MLLQSGAWTCPISIVPNNPTPSEQDDDMTRKTILRLLGILLSSAFLLAALLGGLSFAMVLIAGWFAT
ncbi:MAG: hypothetical protein CMH13_09730 [Martelella sp.]|nr:hypothetical protein [Martelella sp.]|tara:strand:+ start:402 stop:605 length:204 start_codon:yes stop_codon:yes gene_type:complete